MKETSIKRIQPKSSNRGKDSSELANTRKIAVKLANKGPLTLKEIAQITWLWVSTISHRKKVYKQKWWKWFVGKKRSWWRKKNKNNNLTSKEKKVLVSVISLEPRETGKLMLDFGLWTIKLVQDTIEVLFWKKLKSWKARELLIELGFSNQTPLFRAYQQNPEKVEKWLDEELPFILDESKKEWRTIFYGDEAGFRSTNHKGKTRWKKWKTPIVKATWARFWVNAISAISPKWELRFMVYEVSFTWAVLIKFLKQMRTTIKKPITLILDGHPTHKSKLVKEYLKEINDEIKIYYLPWYSPEFNPDEQVRLHIHNDLKGKIIANKQAQISLVRKALHRQQKQKDKVSSYFRHPDMQRNSY